jgi:hypothetical protein
MSLMQSIAAFSNTVNFLKIAFYFSVGFICGAILTCFIDRLYEGGWRGGPTIVWLSLPAAIIYFLLLWGIGVWRPLPFTPVGLAAAGCLCGLFPVLFGSFPIYYYRLIFLVPIAFVQFTLLIGVVKIFAKLIKR